MMFSRFPCDIRDAGFTAQQAARIQAVQVHVGNAAAGFAVVPPWVINGTIWVESRFNPTAVSSAGALGLMQLMPATGKASAQALGIAYRPLDPEANILMGTNFLATLYASISSLEPGGSIPTVEGDPKRYPASRPKLDLIRQAHPEYADFDAWRATFASYYAGPRGVFTTKDPAGVRRYALAVEAAAKRFRDLESFCAGKPEWQPPAPRDVPTPRTPSNRNVPTGPLPPPSPSPTGGGGGIVFLALAIAAAGVL